VDPVFTDILHTNVVTKFQILNRNPVLCCQLTADFVQNPVITLDIGEQVVDTWDQAKHDNVGVRKEPVCPPKKLPNMSSKHFTPNHIPCIITAHQQCQVTDPVPMSKGIGQHLQSSVTMPVNPSPTQISDGHMGSEPPFIQPAGMR
jgi:hypothetical protein